jgi:hypothetical protein
MSRIFWMGVGAAGGIFAYRKATDAVNGVRERSLRENLGKVAQGASTVASSARYLANLTTPETDAEVIDIRPTQERTGSKPIRATPISPVIRPEPLSDHRRPRSARQ